MRRSEKFLPRLIVPEIAFAALLAVVILSTGYGVPSARKDAADHQREGKSVAAGRGPYHPAQITDFLPREQFCAGCHPSAPHARSVLGVKAMLNYHVTRVHCLVCHGRDFLTPSGGMSRKDKILWPSVEGQWLGPDREKIWREEALRKGPCFPVGPGCDECHRPDGLMDFKKLGFDERQAARLQRLEEFLMRSTLDKWFFPSIF